MKTPRLVPALFAALALSAPLSAQDSSLLSGTVVQGETGAPVPNAILRIAGTNVSAVSDATGAFVLRGVPAGAHTLEARHPDYGEHSLPVSVSRPGEQFSVLVRLSTGGISVEVLGATPAAEAVPDLAAAFPVTVTDGLVSEPTTGPAVRTGTVVDRARILQLAGSSQNMGDLIRRAVPTLQVKAAEEVGSTLCLEFRGTNARSMNLAETSATCHHPTVYMDGLVLNDPAAAYAMTSLEALQWIQAIPPGQTGAQFGSSTYGVILVATVNGAARMAAMTGGSNLLVRSRRSSFDWEQDPNGHNFVRTFLGAAVGSAAGLAAGVAAGRHCIYVEDRTQEIETSCRNAGVAGVGLVAFALPAMGSAVGAHYGGRTSISQGKWIPAVIGASMALFPGYVFALTTVGSGVQATNNAGKAFLLLGTPLITTFADRLYRELRAR